MGEHITGFVNRSAEAWNTSVYVSHDFIHLVWLMSTLGLGLQCKLCIGSDGYIVKSKLMYLVKFRLCSGSFFFI